LVSKVLLVGDLSKVRKTDQRRSLEDDARKRSDSRTLGIIGYSDLPFADVRGREIGDDRLGSRVTSCKRLARAASGAVPAPWGPFIHIGWRPKIAIRPLHGNRLSALTTSRESPRRPLESA